MREMPDGWCIEITGPDISVSIACRFDTIASRSEREDRLEDTLEHALLALWPKVHNIQLRLARALKAVMISEGEGLFGKPLYAALDKYDDEWEAFMADEDAG